MVDISIVQDALNGLLNIFQSFFNDLIFQYWIFALPFFLIVLDKLITHIKKLFGR